MVLKGHILPGYTHVGLGNARLDNHLSQELRIEPPEGETCREEMIRDPTREALTGGSMLDETPPVASDHRSHLCLARMEVHEALSKGR